MLEEFVGFVEVEMEWCCEQMEWVVKEFGFDDWKDVLEKVKMLYVEFGRQFDFVCDLVFEVIVWVEECDLLIVFDFVKEVWCMEMMLLECQKMSFFFFGGEVIIVFFFMDIMLYEEKLMSLCGNNEYFVCVMVYYELIFGYYFQGFMMSCYNFYCCVF